MRDLVPDSLLFELVDIDSIKDAGYDNCYDICLDGDHTFILSNGIVSHNSALGGLMPVLGRENVGYYTLKGKPLNAYSQSQKKFTENKELSGLYQVLTNGVETKEMPDGEFYKIEIEGKTIIVNINDEVKIDGRWLKVRDLVSNIEDF